VAAFDDGAPNFAAAMRLAASFGVSVAAVEGERMFAQALGRALGIAGPSLIAAGLDDACPRW
jgi:thiamine pyrophosphate-dependent acetolactate synthase large subunit-like protein